jgi:hypothetical protein
MVIICTIYFNVQEMCILSSVHLLIPYDSQNKQVIVSLKSINYNGVFLWGTDWILKYYLDDLWSYRVKVRYTNFWAEINIIAWYSEGP